MNSMDVDSLTMTVLVPETPAAPTVVFDDNAALKLAIVERSGAGGLDGEWDAAGLYLLIDRSDDEGQWGVYVGQAPAGIKARIRAHLRKKDHWYRALLVRRDTTHGFNSAQIGWLEGRLYDILKSAENARLHNRVRPGDETLAPYDRQALEMVLVSIQRVMRLMGHDSSSGDDDGEDKRPSRYYGIKLKELFDAGLIEAGDVLVSTNGAWPATAQIAPNGKITLNGEEFDKPSNAATAVKEGSANGWDFWARQTPAGLVRLSTLRTAYMERSNPDGD